MDTVWSILLVDPDRDEMDRLAAHLRKETSCVVLHAETPEKALQILEQEDISVLLVGVTLPDKRGFDLMKQVQRLYRNVVAVPMVPAGNRDLVLEALQFGAFFYVQTPILLNEVAITTARALRFYEAGGEKGQRVQKFRKSDGFCGILGQSPKMLELFDLLAKVADDGVSTVLVQGESGTGKELVARAIHARGPRKGKNFVPLNCAAIPSELLESELFGYIKGAFTGAAQSKIGRVQYADKGTLFLDEIGDMDPALQAKLLRVLQEREFEPVGGVKSIPVDVRVVAATHRDLDKAVLEGNFREDLYYRLNVFPVTIPPLRERVEDIPLLISKFTECFSRGRRVGLLGFEPDALIALTHYPWPGNIRELENLIQRLTIIHEGKRIRLEDLPVKYRGHQPLPASKFVAAPEIPTLSEPAWGDQGVDFYSLTSDFEDQLIVRALTLAQGNKKEAARLLNLKRTTLIEKIKKKQLDVLC